MNVKIKFLNKSALVPFKTYATDACYDCYATSKKDYGDGRIEYGLGFALALEDSENALIKSFRIHARSSIHKYGLILSNSEGILDFEYRNEIKAVFYKVIKGLPDYEIGDRICQLELVTNPPIEFEVVNELSVTNRNMNGYGSTGK